MIYKEKPPWLIDIKNGIKRLVQSCRASIREQEKCQSGSHIDLLYTEDPKIRASIKSKAPLDDYQDNIEKEGVEFKKDGQANIGSYFRI